MSDQEQPPVYVVAVDPANHDPEHIDTFVTGMRLPDGRTIMMRARTDTPGPLEEQEPGHMLIRAMMNAMSPRQPLRWGTRDEYDDSASALSPHWDAWRSEQEPPCRSSSALPSPGTGTPTPASPSE